MSKLRIEGVAVRFKGRKGQTVTALEDISLAIPERELSVIVGPSGCGKSTLLRLIAGLAEATEGVITPRRPTDRRPLGRTRHGVPELHPVPLADGPGATSSSASSSSARPPPSAAGSPLRLIRQVGLEGFEQAYPEQLSGGMRQRTALARALANDPEVLLMDEPFGALDSQTRALMQEMLLGIWEQSHKTVLFVTHDIDEALFLGDVVYVMTARPGRIKREIVVDIPRPRGPEVLTAPRFVALKREVLALIREEAMTALAEAEPPGAG